MTGFIFFTVGFIAGITVTLIAKNVGIVRISSRNIDDFFGIKAIR